MGVRVFYVALVVWQGQNVTLVVWQGENVAFVVWVGPERRSRGAVGAISSQSCPVGSPDCVSVTFGPWKAQRNGGSGLLRRTRGLAGPERHTRGLAGRERRIRGVGGAGTSQSWCGGGDFVTVVPCWFA